jgi:hypothetical protein
MARVKERVQPHPWLNLVLSAPAIFAALALRLVTGFVWASFFQCAVRTK